MGANDMRGASANMQHWTPTRNWTKIRYPNPTRGGWGSRAALTARPRGQATGAVVCLAGYAVEPRNSADFPRSLGQFPAQPPARPGRKFYFPGFTGGARQDRIVTPEWGANYSPLILACSSA